MRRLQHDERVLRRPVWSRRSAGALTGILRRAAAGLAIVAGGIVAAYGLGAYLIVRDPLAPAQAIVVLAGGYPVREWEAANLYRAGWAPRVVLVREWLDLAGRRKPDEVPSLEERRALLVRLGVPDSAIEVPGTSSCMTTDELMVAARALSSPERPVILVTSKYHTRRVSLLWRAAVGDSPRGLVQPASEDPFAPDTWFLDRRFVVRVAREYVGLVTAGLPLPTRTPPCGESFVRIARLLDRLVN